MNIKETTLYNVAINDADYFVTQRSSVNGKVIVCPVYRTWKNMLTRVYCPTYHVKHPQNIEVSVCEDWLYFSVFREWALEHHFEGAVLDKDLYDPTSKEYSPETCTFITQAVNQLVQYNPRVKNTELPTGVSLTSSTNRKPYRASIRVDGKVKGLGAHFEVVEAESAYLIAKIDILTDECARNTSDRIKKGLNRHVIILATRYKKLNKGGLDGVLGRT